jgi:hypothetical protein
MGVCLEGLCLEEHTEACFDGVPLAEAFVSSRLRCHPQLGYLEKREVGGRQRCAWGVWAWEM